MPKHMRSGVMSFFQKYGQPTKSKPKKKKTVKDKLLESISKQERLLAGEQVLTPKNTIIASWFKSERFSPKVGLKSLFGKEYIYFEPGSESQLLKDFRESLLAGEFDKYIAELEK